MSAKKGKKKYKHSTEPNVLVNTSALMSSPANSIACLTEMFGEKIEIDVIKLVLSECDNDVNQAAESLSSLVEYECHETRDNFQECLSSKSESNMEMDILQQSLPDAQYLESEKVFSDSFPKSFSSAAMTTNSDNSHNQKKLNINPLASQFKSFSSETSYLSSSPSKNKSNKVVNTNSIVIQHICTVINTLKLNEFKINLPGHFHSQEGNRILSNISLGLPVLIILRGLPGSGKSTLASSLKGKGVVYSTDDYFMQNGSYRFVHSLLPEAHEWNQRRAKSALTENVTPIIIDNTNLMVWEMHPYVNMALKHNYIIEIIEPATRWKFKPSELSKKNSHFVSRKGIEDMLMRYQNLDTVCTDLRKNKFASVFTQPFAGLTELNTKLLSDRKLNSNCKNMSFKSKRFGKDKSSQYKTEGFQSSSKREEICDHDEPNKDTLHKLKMNTMQGCNESNSSTKEIEKQILGKCLKQQNPKSNFGYEISKINPTPKNDFYPFIKNATSEQGLLGEHMKCLQLNIEEDLTHEMLSNNPKCFNLGLDGKPDQFKGVEPADNNEIKCNLVKSHKISETISKLDTCDPDSSESEFSVDVCSESETNYSQSVSSWVTTSEDMSESENSERPDGESITLNKLNVGNGSLNEKSEIDSSTVIPKPPRNKATSLPFMNQILSKRSDSPKNSDPLDIFNKSWVDPCWDSGHVISINNSMPKPRRETWKQIETSSLALISLESKKDQSSLVKTKNQEAPNSYTISTTETEVDLKGNNQSNSLEKLQNPVNLLNQNLAVEIATNENGLSHQMPAHSPKYNRPNLESPKPYNLTPQTFTSEKNAISKNRKQLIADADKYIGKNWGLPDCLTSSSFNPELIIETLSKTLNPNQFSSSSSKHSSDKIENKLVSSETQTESKDFMLSSRIGKNNVSIEELEDSIYKIIAVNVHNTILCKKENYCKVLKEESFSPRSNNQFDASTNTEDYSLDIADHQKLSYITECFPDLTVEEIETYLGLCQGDVHWAVNIIIENGCVSKKSKKELGIDDEKYNSPLNISFKSISLESIPNTPDISPLANAKNWNSDNVLFKSHKETFICADEKKMETHKLLDEVKLDQSENSSAIEEDSLKQSDKIILTLSFEDAQELQFRYGPVVKHEALSAPGSREIALDPELVYSLWMSTQSLKESNNDLCKKKRKKHCNYKPRRNLFPEAFSESNTISSEPQTLSEIMDMEYALQIDEEEKLKKDTRFIKEKRLELYNFYPGMDRRYLDAVFDSNSYNVEESKICIDVTYAMIENDSKTAAASPIVSELKKNKCIKQDSEEAHIFPSNGGQKTHLGRGPNHFLNWVSPDVVSSDSNLSTTYEDRPLKEIIQANHILAQSELASKREWSSKAVKAYQNKMAGVAAYYAEKAREHHWNANEHFQAICELVKQESNSYELDLHGCYVREGFKLLRQFLNHHQQKLKNWPEKDYPRLSIITGYGKHSENGPVLQPSVNRFLRENNYLFSTSKTGSVFYVTLKEKNEEDGKRK